MKTIGFRKRYVDRWILCVWTGRGKEVTIAVRCVVKSDGINRAKSYLSKIQRLNNCDPDLVHVLSHYRS